MDVSTCMFWNGLRHYDACDLAQKTLGFASGGRRKHELSIEFALELTKDEL